MITRFSLWGQPDRWSHDIQEDQDGRWARWVDVENYVQYALDHGYIPPIPPTAVTEQESYTPLVDPEKPEAGFDDTDLLGGDQDLVDLMMISHNDLPAEDGE